MLGAYPSSLSLFPTRDFLHYKMESLQLIDKNPSPTSRRFWWARSNSIILEEYFYSLAKKCCTKDLWQSDRYTINIENPMDSYTLSIRKQTRFDKSMILLTYCAIVKMHCKNINKSTWNNHFPSFDALLDSTYEWGTAFAFIGEFWLHLDSCLSFGVPRLIGLVVRAISVCFWGPPYSFTF